MIVVVANLAWLVVSGKVGTHQVFLQALLHLALMILLVLRELALHVVGEQVFQYLFRREPAAAMPERGLLKRIKPSRGRVKVA